MAFVMKTVLVRTVAAGTLFASCAYAAAAQSPAPIKSVPTPGKATLAAGEMAGAEVLTTWIPDSSPGFINFGGGGPGSGWASLNVKIDPVTGHFGQISHIGNWNIGSGTINVTISPSTPAIPSYTSFDVIKVSGSVNFPLTAPVPGFTVYNNFDLGGGVHSIRLVKW